MLCMAWCHMRQRNRLASGSLGASGSNGGGKFRSNRGSIRSDGLSLQKEPNDLHFPLLLEEEEADQEEEQREGAFAKLAADRLAERDEGEGEGGGEGEGEGGR